METKIITGAAEKDRTIMKPFLYKRKFEGLYLPWSWMEFYVIGAHFKGISVISELQTFWIAESLSSWDISQRRGLGRAVFI